jgi:hypothetical protein
LTTSPASWCSPRTPDPAPPASDRLRPDLASSLCTHGFRPLFITGLLRDLLIRHFTAPAGVEAPSLRDLIWREGNDTGILIESIHRWRGDLVEKRPALIVKRNAYQNLRLGIADRVGADEHGNMVYCTVWVGSHTVFCLHRSGAGVEILATEVQRELTEFHPVMIQELGLMRWAVTEVGEIHEIEESAESFAVPVTVGWAAAAAP